MKYLVVKNHIVNEINHIVLKKNDRVIRGEEYIGNPTWKNWVYCISRDTLKEGWISKAYLKDIGEESILLEDYSSKELDVTVGDVIFCIRTINNWVYCTNERTGEDGWVPLKNLDAIS